MAREMRVFVNRHVGICPNSSNNSAGCENPIRSTQNQIWLTESYVLMSSRRSSEMRK